LRFFFETQLVNFVIFFFVFVLRFVLLCWNQWFWELWKVTILILSCTLVKCWWLPVLIIWIDRYCFLIIIFNRLSLILILQKLSFILRHDRLSLVDIQPIILIAILIFPLVNFFIFSFIVWRISWTLMKHIENATHTFVLAYVAETLDKLITFFFLIKKLTNSRCSLFRNKILSWRRETLETCVRFGISNYLSKLGWFILILFQWKPFEYLLFIDILLYLEQVMSTHSVVALRTYTWRLYDLIRVNLIKEIGGSCGKAVVPRTNHFVSASKVYLWTESTSRSVLTLLVKESLKVVGTLKNVVSWSLLLKEGPMVFFDNFLLESGVVFLGHLTVFSSSN